MSAEKIEGGVAPMINSGGFLSRHLGGKRLGSKRLRIVSVEGTRRHGATDTAFGAKSRP